MMNKRSSMYKRHRFPPEIIQYVVWLYHRFNLSARDIEDLMAERGIAVSYESIRLWCIKFGSKYTKRLKRRHCGYGDTFYVDEDFVKIRGVHYYLWRAVDQDGEVVDVYLQERRDATAARRFFNRFLNSGGTPRKIITDKLRSYGVAHRSLIPEVRHKAICQQSSRAFPSTHPCPRTRNATLRIGTASSAVSGKPRRYLQLVQSAQALAA